LKARDILRKENAKIKAAKEKAASVAAAAAQQQNMRLSVKVADGTSDPKRFSARQSARGTNKMRSSGY
jgi:hypothetical protein